LFLDFPATADHWLLLGSPSAADYWLLLNFSSPEQEEGNIPEGQNEGIKRSKYRDVTYTYARK
jgi:hypothetical protein